MANAPVSSLRVRVGESAARALVEAHVCTRRARGQLFVIGTFLAGTGWIAGTRISRIPSL